MEDSGNIFTKYLEHINPSPLLLKAAGQVSQISKKKKSKGDVKLLK